MYYDLVTGPSHTDMAPYWQAELNRYSLRMHDGLVNRPTHTDLAPF